MHNKCLGKLPYALKVEIKEDEGSVLQFRILEEEKGAE